MIPPQPFTAGVAQFDVITGDTETNLATALQQTDVLAGKGADLVLLPEMWSCGFDNRHLGEHAREVPAILEAVSEKAKKKRTVIAGTVPEEEGDDIYNTLFVIDRDGSVAGSYRKIHLFTPTGEHNYFSAGSTPVACDTSLGRIGLMICYDLRFPELCRILALNGAWTVLVSAQWPVDRIGHWNTLLKARAIENQLFMVAANTSGSDEKLTLGGCSRIVSPTGDILGKSEDNRAATIIVKIDPREMDKARENVTYLDDRSPGSYEGLI